MNNENDLRTGYEALEEKLGYVFKDKNLIKLALTHSSYANEHNIECN